MKILKIVFVIVTMIVAINIFTPETSAVQVKNFDQMKSSIQTFMNKGKNGNLQALIWRWFFMCSTIRHVFIRSRP